jgi:NADH dehydrogenase FAD-containing subunit
MQPGRHVTGRLISSAPTLLPGMAPGAVRAAERALTRAGVALHLNTVWHDEMAEDAAARQQLLLWATGALAHAWQRDPARRGGLATGEQGFVSVDSRLRSVSHPQVFAAGDCAQWSPPLPKAGVYAVRMGAVLAQNLRAALNGETGIPYRPQQRFLALLATADGRAIGSRGRWSTEGRWLWHWKDHIDRGFLRRFKVR